jgi:hypothetical protein
MMALAGRACRGAATLVSRLEQGKIRYPSFGLVVDYLRACRADFSVLADLLSDYTAQPVALEAKSLAEVRCVVESLPARVSERVISYPTQLALMGEGEGARPPAPETPEEQMKRRDAFTGALVAGRSVEEAVVLSLEMRGWLLSPKQVRWLTGVGRECMRLCVRWPGPEGRVRVRLRRRKDRAKEQAFEFGLAAAQVEAVCEQVWEARCYLKKYGTLERCPAIAKLSQPGHGEYRRSVRRQRQLAFERECDYACAEVTGAAREAIEGKLPSREAYAAMEPVLSEVSGIAMDRNTTVEQKRARIAAFAARNRYAELVAGAGEAAILRWERMKATVPTEPAPPGPEFDRAEFEAAVRPGLGTQSETSNVSVVSRAGQG